MNLIGYARVSSTDQSLDVQEDALKAAGCQFIRSEKVSGKSREGRTELENLLGVIRANDVLTVHKLDRLGRSTRDVLNLVHELEQRGAHLRVLEPALDTSGPMGRMAVTVLGMVAEMELGFIKERQRSGIERAKKAGVYAGRKATIDADQVRRLKADGIGAAAIAKQLGIGRASVYRLLD
ncbi:recombinase family protein [Aestuariivirga sp.]|uniref:recombinase family protein n=1 Tax=Aestuariivirga sp. TaxID=2650926 RepID=UPI003593745E